MNKKQIPRGKRPDPTRLFIYTIMTISVVVIVAILVLIISGYRYNQYDGTLSQGGLVQFNSRPSGASVYIDDMQLANRTPSKITTTAGVHNFKMTRQGYHDWTTQAEVRPGSILWLNYARMVPKELKTTTVADFDQLSGAVMSENHKLYAIKTDPATPSFSVVNIDSNTPKVEPVALSEGSYTIAPEGQPSVFELVRWDYDNRYVLIKHTYGESKTEWLVADSRGDRPTFNVATSLGLDVQSADFTLDSNRSLYVLTAQHDLRRVSIDAVTATGPLLTNVQSFDQYDRSTITYTTLADSETQQRSAGYLTKGDDSSRVVKSVTDIANKPLHISIGKYYGKTYTAVAYGAQMEVLVGDLSPSGADEESELISLATVTIPSDVTKLGFSPSENRYVYAENAAGVVVRDLELRKTSTVNLEGYIPGALRWIDEQHFVDTSAALAMYDFDGANNHQLAPATFKAPVVISPNNKYIYHLVVSETGGSIQRISMLLD